MTQAIRDESRFALPLLESTRAHFQTHLSFYYRRSRPALPASFVGGVSEAEDEFRLCRGLPLGGVWLRVTDRPRVLRLGGLREIERSAPRRRGGGVGEREMEYDRSLLVRAPRAGGERDNDLPRRRGGLRDGVYERALVLRRGGEREIDSDLTALRRGGVRLRE